MRTAPLFFAAMTLSLPAQAQSPVVTDNPAAAPAAGLIEPGDQAVYEEDMENWRAEVRATNRANNYSADLYARQQRAYADAMRAWRIQVADCRRGITAACRAPTPRPGDFM